MSRLGWFAVALCVWTVAGCTPAQQRPNIVLIVVDTLRADRVSSYGYAKPTTPRIDALAARGVRFANAYSTSSWTLPAHATMFTGLFPIEHGATQENTHLDDRPTTLAEAFAKEGYTTIGVSANGVINAGSGLTRGFDVFVEAWRKLRERGFPPVNGWFEPTGHPNVVAIREFLNGHDAEDPFFAFVNFIEPHGPYTPPTEFRDRHVAPDTPKRLLRSAQKRAATRYYLNKKSISKAEFKVLSDLYDGEVAYVDGLVGALVDEIEAAGLLSDTLVVITSDHGENIGEHNHFRHVFSLYNETVHVPLIALLPGGARAGEVRTEPVSLIDLYATLLSAARIDPGTQSQGRDFLAEGPADGKPVFAEYYYPIQALGLFDTDDERHRAAVAPYLRRLRSVQFDGWRLIWSSDGKFELYNVDRDPNETVDLVGDSKVAIRAGRLRATMNNFIERRGGRQPLPEAAGQPAGAFGGLDSETEQQLRELGYLPEQ